MTGNQLAAEGVIKYRLEFIQAAAPVGDIGLLNTWRRILHGLRWIGQDPDRYSGYGYGNVSQRLKPAGDQFVTSASQTGGLPTLDRTHYSLVESVDFEQMAVRARGLGKPSSEALSHAMIYQLDTLIGCVLHVHDRRMWRHALAHGYPASAPQVEYGSGQMASEVERLYRSSGLRRAGVLAMAGHEDGIIAFGVDANQAGCRLLQLHLEAI